MLVVNESTCAYCGTPSRLGCQCGALEQADFAPLAPNHPFSQVFNVADTPQPLGQPSWNFAPQTPSHSPREPRREVLPAAVSQQPTLVLNSNGEGPDGGALGLPEWTW
jgi:hypothetical protein